MDILCRQVEVLQKGGCWVNVMAVKGLTIFPGRLAFLVQEDTPTRVQTITSPARGKPRENFCFS
jgi:hypothetical protein